MGCKTSKVTNICNNEWIIAKNKADIIYNYRLKNYNPILHGTRKYYMSIILNEYKLNCIPLQFRNEFNTNFN
jgi:hypothetical protein